MFTSTVYYVLGFGITMVNEVEVHIHRYVQPVQERIVQSEAAEQLKSRPCSKRILKTPQVCIRTAIK